MDEELNLHKAIVTVEMCLDWYCYAKEEQMYNSHPLSYEHLEKAQHADMSLKKILEMDNLPFQYHSLQGG